MKKTFYILPLAAFIACGPIAQEKTNTKETDTQKTVVISGVITDCKQHQPIAGMAVELMCADQKQEVITDAAGRYSIKITPPEYPWVCLVVANSQLSDNGSLDWSMVQSKFTLTKESSLNITDNMCETAIDLKGKERVSFINFGKNSKEIPGEETASLNRIIKMMKDHPYFKLGIKGYVFENEKLINERIQIVQQKLIAEGIEAKRMVVQKPGDGFPEDPNSAFPPPPQNNTIEFSILK